MSVVEPGTAGAGLVERIKNILLKPKETWAIIDDEPATVGGLYKGYAMPLAAILAVCFTLRSWLVGYGAYGFVLKTPLLAALVGGLVNYLAGLGMLYVAALIIDALAPNFGGTRNTIQAFKVIVYSYTAVWVTSVVILVPFLAPVMILALLYTLYLLYLGLPRLMKTPEDKALPYTALVIVAGLVVGIVVMSLSSMVMRSVGGLGMMGAMANRGHVSGEVKVGGTTVDLGKLEAASRQMEAAAKQMQDGKGPDGKAVTPTDPDVLKAYLPAAVAGFSRSEVSTGSGGVGGMEGSNAKADYTRGDARLSLSVTDLGAAGAFGALAGAFNVRSSSESDGHYQKVGKVDGRLTQESFDKNTKHGEYSVLAGDRFMIQAEGDNVSIDDLKAAVGAVDPARMEQLASAG